MAGFQVRHVVSSSTGRRVLFGAFEQEIVIFDLLSGTRSETIQTTFDFGGRRLALSDEVDGVLAAAYYIHGLALYFCNTGREVWRRKDVKKVQCITLSRDGIKAYCGIEGSSLLVIDLYSGETVRKIKGAVALYDSPYDRVKFLDGTRPQVLEEDGHRRFYVERTTFAFLDVAFAPGLLCVSEAGGPVRCIDLLTGHEQWRYDPPSGTHLLSLSYCDEGYCFLGIEWSFEKGGTKRMLRLSYDEGIVLGSFDVGMPGGCTFALDGKVLVTSDGKIFDTTTGKVVAEVSI
ncbi:hypothetical protein [Lutibacter sp.]